jgi:hypothetical protein
MMTAMNWRLAKLKVKSGRRRRNQRQREKATAIFWLRRKIESGACQRKSVTSKAALSENES